MTVSTDEEIKQRFGVEMRSVFQEFYKFDKEWRDNKRMTKMVIIIQKVCMIYLVCLYSNGSGPNFEKELISKNKAYIKCKNECIKLLERMYDKQDE